MYVCLSVCIQGETSVASATSCPVWNEEISFIEQFPPLAQRIRVQILDDAKMGDIALATHFLDLQQISDHTRNGTTCSLHILQHTIIVFLSNAFIYKFQEYIWSCFSEKPSCFLLFTNYYKLIKSLSVFEGHYYPVSWWAFNLKSVWV